MSEPCANLFKSKGVAVNANENASSSTHSGHPGPRATPGRRRSKCCSAGKPATRALGVAQPSPQRLSISLALALALALARSVPTRHLGARSSSASVARCGPSYVPVVVGPKQSMGFQADRRRHWALARQPLHARVGVGEKWGKAPDSAATTRMQALSGAHCRCEGRVWQ